MVKIRLTRTGRKNYATFRLAVTEARTKRETKAIELVGYYLPHDKKIEVDAERIKYWMSVGAQPSETVTRLLVRAGVLGKESLPKRKFAKKPGRKATERNAKKAEKAEAAKQAAAAPKVVEPEPVVEAVAVAPEAEVEAVTETNE